MPQSLKPKQRISVTDEDGVTHTLLDTSGDPTWDDVKCVEQFFMLDGRLSSVVNHRDKTYARRLDELLTQRTPPAKRA